MAITRAVANVKYTFGEVYHPCIWTGEIIKSSNLFVSFLKSKNEVSSGVPKFLYKVVLWFFYPNPAEFGYQEHCNYDTSTIFYFCTGQTSKVCDILFVTDGYKSSRLSNWSAQNTTGWWYSLDSWGKRITTSPPPDPPLKIPTLKIHKIPLTIRFWKEKIASIGPYFIL